MQGTWDAKLMSDESRLTEPLGSETMLLPDRRMDIDLTPYSSVLSNPGPVCYPNAPLEFQVRTMDPAGSGPLWLGSLASRTLTACMLRSQPTCCSSSVSMHESGFWPAVEPSMKAISGCLVVASSQTRFVHELLGVMLMQACRQVCLQPRMNADVNVFDHDLDKLLVLQHLQQGCVLQYLQPCHSSSKAFETALTWSGMTGDIHPSSSLDHELHSSLHVRMDGCDGISDSALCTPYLLNPHSQLLLPAPDKESMPNASGNCHSQQAQAGFCAFVQSANSRRPARGCPARHLQCFRAALLLSPWHRNGQEQKPLADSPLHPAVAQPS